jgi:hypothetical protein
MIDDTGMTSPKLVNIGTPERPKWVKESLVWSNSSQSREDHRNAGVASGSVLSDAPNLNNPSKSSHEQKP